MVDKRKYDDDDDFAKNAEKEAKHEEKEMKHEAKHEEKEMKKQEKEFKHGEKKIVTAVFPDRDSAERAYAAAIGRGYGEHDISMVMTEKTRDMHFRKGDERIELDRGNKAGKGAVTGGVIGGAGAGIAAAIAAIGTSRVIPGLGLIVAGPLAAGLAGAGAGVMAGGLIGALVGTGIPEDKVKVYEERIKKGDILVGVHPRNDEDAIYLENQWRTSHGEEIYR